MFSRFSVLEISRHTNFFIFGNFFFLTIIIVKAAIYHLTFTNDSESDQALIEIGVALVPDLHRQKLLLQLLLSPVLLEAARVVRRKRSLLDFNEFVLGAA